MRRFLKFCVDQSLASGGGLKEYAVALAVYDKASSFDLSVDPIMRVEASRLRSKLRVYDEEESEDPVIISIRKGGYSAIFRKRRIARPTSRSQESLTESHHLYLMGNHYWNKQSSKSLQSVIDCSSAGFRRRLRRSNR
jgi:hypothetical protein